MWPENVQEIEVSTEKLTLGDKSTVHNLMSVGKKGLITQCATFSLRNYALLHWRLVLGAWVIAAALIITDYCQHETKTKANVWLQCIFENQNEAEDGHVPVVK